MCTLEKRGSLHILTLTGPGEHRLSPTLIDAIRLAVRRVKADATSSSALITTAQGKFFSNGFDLAWAQSIQSNLLLMARKLQCLISELISLPMPTIAAVSGHASAAGFLFALSHDYVLMRKDRGFLYMSEVDIGIVIPAFFMSLIECKVGKSMAVRDIVLRAAKLTANEAVEKGVIDGAYDSPEETFKAAVALCEELVKKKWNGHVYAQNRMVVLRKVLAERETEESVAEVTSTASKL